MLESYHFLVLEGVAAGIFLSAYSLEWLWRVSFWSFLLAIMIEPHFPGLSRGGVSGPLLEGSPWFLMQ